MTIFEKNMTDDSLMDDGVQTGFFDKTGKPADADLTWIEPDMMELVHYEWKSGDVDFWFNDRGLYAPYVCIRKNGDIIASNLQAIKGHEDTPSVLQSFNNDRGYTIGDTDGTLLGQNIRLAPWMYYKAKQLSMEGGR